MQPARRGTHFFRHRGGEGDHVMFDLSLNLLNAVENKVAAVGNGLGRVLRDDPGFSQRETGGHFHLQPAAELVFVTPNPAHLRAGVARDQGVLPSH